MRPAPTRERDMSDQSLPHDESTRAEAAKLTRRRAKMQVARSTAAAAGAKLTDLEGRLESLTRLRRQQKAALREAKNQQSVLERAIKASTKQRGPLRESLKKARKAAAKAQRRAHDVEARYDRAVLADMVHREKQTDLSTHTSSGAAARPSTQPALDESPHGAVAAIAPARERPVAE
jgi:chromosome segregation ATPase